MLISLSSHVPPAPYLFMSTLTWSLGRGDSYGHKHAPQSFISPSDSILSDSNSLAGSSFPSPSLRWFLVSRNPGMPRLPNCCVPIVHHLFPMTDVTGAGRAISFARKNTHALWNLLEESCCWNKVQMRRLKVRNSLNQYNTGQTKEFMKNERITKPVGTKSHDLRSKSRRTLWIKPQSLRTT